MGSPDHVCADTDGEWTRCLLDWSGEHHVYGECSDERCGGVCERKFKCRCECHQKAEGDKP